MKTLKTAEGISSLLRQEVSAGKRVGFVATMGALHSGHLSLVNRAKKDCDIVVASIFVNPLQFNNPEDFRAYPSSVEQDCRLLEEVGCDYLFLPDNEAVYGGFVKKKFDLGFLDMVMEGKFRPGHFQGVANVVYRLFEILRPHIAYFGRKDYQQLLVIRKMASEYFPEITIVGMDTVRDENGLAMSSRNLRLSPSEYQHALVIPRIWKELREKIPGMSLGDFAKYVERTVNSEPELKLEYFQFADAETLAPVEDFVPGGHIVACIALYAGEVRLIDNFELK